MSESPPEGPNTPRAAFTLDLSSGKSAAKAKRPKGFVPVVQQTINLTRKKPDAPGASTEAARPSPAPAAPAPRDARPTDTHRSGPPPPQNTRRRDERRDERRDDGRRDDRGDRPSGGTGLADFLDAATLARLRGGA